MPRLKRNYPVSLHLQLYESLRSDIQAQRLKPHQQLEFVQSTYRGDRYKLRSMLAPNPER